MADVQQDMSNAAAPGIKLFGATISVKEGSREEEEPKKDENTLAEKRPEKIIPCPRCRSMETKFCYFNNYNVNQPRHFCKGCQRYWTAGGALRNVPVGAGRRKNKPPVSEGGCMFVDAAAGVVVQQLDFDEWRAAAEADGGFGRHLFPAKRRRCGSDSQTC